MPIISRNAIVPYTPLEMYQLVDNIEDYPDFLPWCKSSIIHQRDEDEVTATLCLARSGLQKSFTTRNRLQKGKMIEVRLVDGPFRHLEGYWRFKNLHDKACKVELDLEFEFAGKILSYALGPIFNQIAHSLVDAFTNRALDRYGRREI